MTGLRLCSAAWARVFRQARLCHLAPPKPHNSAPLWGRTPRRTGVTCVTLAALAAALALLPLIPPALANDSEAEIGVGGIVLKQGTPIIMASEDLFLSEDKVRVTYRFENPSDKDIRTTVAFPLPGQPRGMLWQWFELQQKHDWKDFAYSTKVNGAPVSFKAIELAVIGTRDVTNEVKASGLPFDWYLDEPFDKSVDALSEERRAALIKQGLLIKDERFNGVYVPAWDVATWFVREQLFPANSTITVEHEYKPILGGSVGGGLYPSVRKENPQFLKDYEEVWCTDRTFIAGVDRRLTSAKPGKSVYYGETWLTYVLSPGANWNGPIRDFLMVVDKGAPENLVSFCMDGVKKIAPTQFEVRKKDFTPKDELRILILKFDEYDDVD